VLMVPHGISSVKGLHPYCIILALNQPRRAPSATVVRGVEMALRDPPNHAEDENPFQEAETFVVDGIVFLAGIFSYWERGMLILENIEDRKDGTIRLSGRRALPRGQAWRMSYEAVEPARCDLR